MLRHIRVVHIFGGSEYVKKPSKKIQKNISGNPRNDVELDVIEADPDIGQLELKESGVDSSQPECPTPRLRPRNSAPVIDIVDVDSNGMKYIIVLLPVLIRRDSRC